MKMHKVALTVACIFAVPTVFADETSTPDLLSGLAGNVEVITDAESANLRGEYFDSWNALNNFCWKNASKCDLTGYSKARPGKLLAINRYWSWGDFKWKRSYRQY